MNSQTALVLQLPELHKIIGDYLRTHSPAAAAGLDAHLTLLFPFLPGDPLPAEQVLFLQQFFARQAPLRLSLIGTARFPGVLYLTLAHDDRIRRLVQAIRAEFPHLPPAAGTFDDQQPHITIARAAQDSALNRLEALFWQKFRHHFPLAISATNAALIQEQNGRLLPLHTFLLGA